MTRSGTSRRREIALQLLPFLTVAALWEGLSRLGVIRELFLPPLSAVLTKLQQILIDGSLVVNFGLTVGRMLLGFGIALVGGVALGLVLALSRPLRSFFEPLLAAVYPLPKISMLSLFIVWFGFGSRPIIAILAISAFFPIFISTMTGVVTVDNLLVQAARNLGARPSQLLTKVALPSALPVMFGGMRISSSLSFLVVVALEMYIGDSGVGYLLRWATTFYMMDLLYAVLLAIGAFGVALFKFIGLVERWLMPWHKSNPLTP